MAIQIALNDTLHFFNLTTDPNANFGLEDDPVVGLGGNDVLYTGAGNDHLEGGEGTNYYADGDGDDTVLGGSGRDAVQVDAGNDLYFGAGGADTLLFDLIHYGFKGAFKVAYQGVTVDLSLTSAQDLGEFGIDRFFGFENVLGSFGNDTILGTDGVNSIDGGVGNDVLYGREGNDKLTGDDGADTLIGGLGQDTIDTSLIVQDASQDIVRYESLKDSGTTDATRDTIYGFTKGQDKIDLSKLDANLGLKGNQAFKVVKGFTKAFGEASWSTQG